MTPIEFDEALIALGWSQRYLAILLQCDTNLPGRWRTGRAEVPAVIAQWLRRRVKGALANPVPLEWRARPHTPRGPSRPKEDALAGSRESAMERLVREERGRSSLDNAYTAAQGRMAVGGDR